MQVAENQYQKTQMLREQKLCTKVTFAVYWKKRSAAALIRVDSMLHVLKNATTDD